MAVRRKRRLQSVEPLPPAPGPGMFGQNRRPTNAIVAAANRVMPDKFANLRIPRESWQEEAWRQYDLNGVLRFACTWMGNAASKCRLYAADVDAGGKVIGETEDEEVQALVAGFMGSPGKQAEMLMSIAVHLTVPGDCYIVATVAEDGGFASWEIVSIDEIKPGIGGGAMIDDGSGKPRAIPTGSALIFRVHRPHPRKKFWADSPTRAALPALREHEQLTKYIFATIDSRLAGAGILLLPQELDFPTPAEDIQPGESPFLALLAEAMMASIKDRGDARAVVPIVVQGPKDALGSAQWLISPAQQLSMDVAELRDKATKAIALDLDMPAEIVLGIGDASHWGAWAVEESSIKMHVEPLMTIIVSAFTEGYLKPALIAAGKDPRKFAIWFDPSGLRLRPNRSADAVTLYNIGELSGDALRVANGFTDEDGPQGEEKAWRQIEKALKAAPNLGEPLLKAIAKALGLFKLGITEDDLRPAPDPEGGTTPNPSQPAPPKGKDDKSPPTPGSEGGGKGENGG
jgi:hypothetical protein